MSLFNFVLFVYCYLLHSAAHVPLNLVSKQAGFIIFKQIILQRNRNEYFEKMISIPEHKLMFEYLHQGLYIFILAWLLAGIRVTDDKYMYMYIVNIIFVTQYPVCT